jgi:hypothetical protein
MQKQVVIFSLSLAAVSTGTAVWLALRGLQPTAAVETPAAPRAAAKLTASSGETAKPNASSARKPVTTAEVIWDKDTVGIGGLIREDVQLPKEPRPASIAEVPAAELAKRVALVEKETNHEMRRLVGLLNLTDAQQDQVYEKLAASSRHWVPGMAIAADGGGVVIPDSPKTASGAVTDASEDIMALLNADQQETLLTAEMDRAAWWAEIITQLDSQTDIPAIDGTVSPPAEPEVKAYEGSDTLE